MTLYRIPIGGWKKCVYAAAAFESQGEYAAAKLLDTASVIVWWLRNDPPVLRIPTPLGYFEPDLLYFAKRGGIGAFGALEIKGDVFWDGEGSEARVKAAAAYQWAAAIAAARCDALWEFAVVLDQDAMSATSFEGMRGVAQIQYPQAPRAER